MFSVEFPSAREAQPKSVICCSCGNDSVALMQWAKNQKLKNVYVLYNRTGWEALFWADRIFEIKKLCIQYGFSYVETQPVRTFKELVRYKKGFPMAASSMSWCTQYLKTMPTQDWLYRNDPDSKATIYTGVRREESQNRAKYRRIKRDHSYGDRRVEQPLVGYTEVHRDALIDLTGVEKLPHGSQECFPCINAKRSDFRLLAQYPDRVAELAALEREMGYTSKGKPRVMFRPYRHMGALGINEVVRWGLCDRGKYRTKTA